MEPAKILGTCTTHVLASMAKIKLKQLEKAKHDFDQFRQRLDSITLNSLNGSKFEQSKQMLEESRRFWGPSTTVIGQSTRANVIRDTLANCQLYLQRASLDPDFEYLIDRVKQDIMTLVDSQKHQLEYTQLFTKEILFAHKEQTHLATTHLDPENQTEQLKKWRENTQTPDKVDADRVTKYLGKVFETTESGNNAIKEVRRTMQSVNAIEINFNECLETTISSLIESGMLDHNQQATLQEYTKNKPILEELANVLQTRITELDNWDWTLAESDAGVAYQHHQPNGDYRVFLEYDLIDAIMWWAIGDLWCQKFRDTALQVFNKYWKKPGLEDFDSLDYRRRKFYLGQKYASSFHDSIVSRLDSLYSQQFFMSGIAKPQNNFDSRQKLLEFIAADAKVYQMLEEPLAVLTSSYTPFGPTLSFTAVFKVLEYFGVSESWIKLFKRYLEIPFQFSGYHREFRKRGLPEFSNLSYLFSETLFFVLDYAFNQETRNNIFRMDNDLWIWGNDLEVMSGWLLLEEFNNVMGLELDQEKTGSQSTIPLDALPSGKVQSGYLTLDESFNLVVDTTKFDQALAEMRKHLGTYTSTFNRISAYNSYTRAILAKCHDMNTAFGIEHARSIVYALLKPIDPVIQDKLRFLLTNSSLQQKFMQLGLGVWYWPITLGGFELFDPLADPLSGLQPLLDHSKSIQESFDPTSLVEEYEKFEKEYKIRIDYGTQENITGDEQKEWKDEGFMSFQEFKTYARYTRESVATKMFSALVDANICNNSIRNITSSTIDSRLVEAPTNIESSLASMSPYWQNIVIIYTPEILRKNGSLQLVRKELAPIGLATALSAKDQAWIA